MEWASGRPKSNSLPRQARTASFESMVHKSSSNNGMTSNLGKRRWQQKRERREQPQPRKNPSNKNKGTTDWHFLIVGSCDSDEHDNTCRRTSFFVHTGKFRLFCVLKCLAYTLWHSVSSSLSKDMCIGFFLSIGWGGSIFVGCGAMGWFGIFCLPLFIQSCF